MIEVKESIKELRDSYELRHCKWAKRCLDTIEEELEKKNKIIDKATKLLGDLQLSKDLEEYEIMNTSDWKRYFEKEIENE